MFCVRVRLTNAGGFEQQRRRPLPAAETGRSCWGSVLIFQGPAKGLRKNQQTQLVRPVVCIGTYKGAGLEDRNVYRDSFTCRKGQQGAKLKWFLSGQSGHEKASLPRGTETLAELVVTVPSLDRQDIHHKFCVLSPSHKEELKTTHPTSRRSRRCPQRSRRKNRFPVRAGRRPAPGRCGCRSRPSRAASGRHQCSRWLPS